MIRSVIPLLMLAPPLLAAPAKVDALLDIGYVKNGLDRHKLDVFKPEGRSDRPVVLLVHGGSWMIGDKNFFGMYRDVAVGLAKQGFVVVAANYRLSPWVRHPEHVRDVARAFRWARANARQHGGNPDAVFLLGHSAGGHLVSLLATDKQLLDDGERKAIRGVVSVSGVYTIPRPKEFARLLDGMVSGLDLPESAQGFVRRTGTMFNPFPLVFGTDEKVHREASPLHHVRDGLPPFLLLYAESELPFLADMAREFGDALKKAKNDADVKKIDRRNHNSIFFNAHAADDPVNQAIVAFVKRLAP
jgi:acetyl esterase/lipase